MEDELNQTASEKDSLDVGAREPCAVLSPDEVVKSLLNDLIYGYAGSTIAQIWKLAAKYVYCVDDFMKLMVWSWILDQSDHFSLFRGSEQLVWKIVAQWDSKKVLEEENELTIFASENDVWTELTGTPKAGNTLGKFPFEILCALAKERERGLTSVEINRITGQDARSLSGRIKLLADRGLIKKTQMVANKIYTHHLVISQFASEDTTTNIEGSVNTTEVKRRLLELLQESPSGMKRLAVVQAELAKLCPFPKRIRALLLRYNYKGNLSKVRVSLTENGSSVICLKLLKPFTIEADDDDSDLELYEQDDDDDIDDAGPSNTHVADNSIGNLPQSLPAVVNDVKELKEREPCKFSLFFPLENQIYDVVSQKGVQGADNFDILQLTGHSYKKYISRFLEALSVQSSLKGKKSSKIPPEIEYLQLIRGLDNRRRVQFYRYFTMLAYGQLANVQPSSLTGKLPVLPNASKLNHNVKEMEKKVPAELPGHLGYMEKDGKVVPLFQYDKNAVMSVVSQDQGNPKRGRPRKGEIRESKVKKRKVKVEDTDVDPVLQPSDEIAVSLLTTELQEPRESSVTGRAEHPRPVSNVIDKLAALVSQESPSLDSSTTNLIANMSKEQVQELGLPIVKKPLDQVVKDKKGEKRIFIASEKRDKNFMELLNELKVAEVGDLLVKFRKKFPQDSVLDRKTLYRSLERLEIDKKLRMLYVTVPARGNSNLPQTKGIVMLSSLSPESEEVRRLREEIIEDPKKRYSQKLPRMQKLSMEIESMKKLLGDSSGLESNGYKRLVNEIRNKEKGTDANAAPSNKEFRSKKLPKTTTKKIMKDSLSRRKRVKEEVFEGDPVVNHVNSIQQPKVDRRLKMAVEMSHSEAFWRLIIIVRSYFAGSQQVIPWEKFLPAFNKYCEVDWSIDRAKAAWPTIAGHIGGMNELQRARKEWEDLFLECYEQGIFPEIKSHDDYDVLLYLRFWKAHDMIQRCRSLKLENRHEFIVERYPSANRLLNRFSKPPKIEPLPQTTRLKVEYLLTNTPFLKQRPSEKSMDDKSVRKLDDCKTAIRAIVAASEGGERYREQQVTSAMNCFSEKEILDSIESLEQERAIHYTSKIKELTLPGRSFGFSEKFDSLFSISIGNNYLLEARAFEEEIGHSLQREGKYFVKPNLADSAFVAIFENLASKSLKATRFDAHGDLPDGHTYKTRTFNRSFLDCDIYLLPNNGDYRQTKISETDNSCLVKKPLSHLWVGPAGTLSRIMWTKLVQRLMLHVALLPGVNLEGLQSMFNIAVSLSDMKVLVDWLLQIGALVANDSGLHTSRHWHYYDYRLSSIPAHENKTSRATKDSGGE